MKIEEKTEIVELIHNYIKENLKISIRESGDEYSGKYINVEIFLGGEEICSSCS